MPKFSSPRSAAAHELIRLDMTELADGFRRAAAQFECARLGIIEFDTALTRAKAARGVVRMNGKGQAHDAS